MAKASDEIRAQLEVVELEEELAEAKKGKSGKATHLSDADYRDLKHKVREARRKAREARAQSTPGPGDVRPEPVRAGVTSN
jgi:hypothetical protein